MRTFLKVVFSLVLLIGFAGSAGVALYKNFGVEAAVALGFWFVLLVTKSIGDSD